MGLKTKKGVSRSGALCQCLLGPGLLRSHVIARGKVQKIAGGVWRRRRREERCIGSERIKDTAQTPL
jgi:hypothetical protein